GTALSDDHVSLTASQAAALWEQLHKLHAARISHRRIDLDRVGTRDDSEVAFVDLSSASVQCEEIDALKDRAQLFTLTVLAAGEAVALAAARTALGDPGLSAVLPYVQPAAAPPLVRSALRKSHVSLDNTRKRGAELLGTSEPELVKVQRVTWRSFLRL